jgi:hypothetical protein
MTAERPTTSPARGTIGLASPVATRMLLAAAGAWWAWARWSMTNVAASAAATASAWLMLALPVVATDGALHKPKTAKPASPAAIPAA